MTRQRIAALVGFLIVPFLLTLAGMESRTFDVDFNPDAERVLPGPRPPTSAHVNWAGMVWPTTTTTSTTSTTLVAQSAEPEEVWAGGAATSAPQDHEDASPPLGQGEGGMGDKLARIRDCESGGNYAYDDGKYTGAYNFDSQTHRSVGGDGDASDDTPAEQDAAAVRLHAARGWAPWPICGQQ